MSKFEDQTRTCVECEQEFTWTGGEQEFFHEKGFTDPPIGVLFSISYVELTLDLLRDKAA
jgi:hypothetical protein